MSAQLILLPGWGLGRAALEPLADALSAQASVVIHALPDFADADVDSWLDNLPEGTWLGGWSLGGMLASRLAARRGAACRGLLTFASNALFVARPEWPTAMPLETFTAFRDAYAQSPAATLKRFAMLCAQGAADPRGLGRQLLATADGNDTLAGLDQLAALDSRADLQAYAGPQLHLFAAGDALVPAAAASALQALLPDAEVRRIEAASHGFVAEQVEQLADAVSAFMEKPR